MGWEQFISAETLYTSSSVELEQIQNDLRRSLNKHREDFLSYRKWIIQEFIKVLTWYKGRYKTIVNHEEKEAEFTSQLEDCKTVPELAINLDNLIRHGDFPSELRKMLKNKYVRLSLSGDLPRDFMIQIRPLIILEVQQIYFDFLDKVNGVFTKVKTKQIETFENLIKRISVAENEDEAKEALHAAEIIIKNHGLRDVLFNPFNERGNQLLLCGLLELTKSLDNNGYLRKPIFPKDDIESLQQVINIIEIQIVLKSISLKEQIEQMVLANELAFSLLKVNQSRRKITLEFIQEQEYILKKIGLVQNLQEKGLENLSVLYSEYWTSIAISTQEKFIETPGKRKKEWFDLNLQVLMARKNLQRSSYLTEDFVIDRRVLIVDRFDRYIKKAYQHTIFGLGEERVEQLDYLSHQLKNVQTAEHAAQAIYIAIEEIQQDHQEKSFGFNCTFLRKKSRAACALQALLKDCEAENILPRLSLPQPSVVEQHLAKAVNEYFSNDILFSNREYRRITRKLLTGIRLIEDQIKIEKILLIDGQELIAELLEVLIEESKTQQKHNPFVKRMLSYLPWNKTSAFVAHLKHAQKELITNKKLVRSYRNMHLPVIESKIQQAILSYINDVSICHEDKELGAREATELLIQIQNATNPDVACDILSYGIRSFSATADSDKVFPILAKKLEATYQLLRMEHILPPRANTEFSETVRKQIKLQARELSELRTRLFKIS